MRCAVEAGDDELARKALVRKQEHDKLVVALEDQITLAREAAQGAGQLVSFIKNADKEVARISADVDEQEILKLEARIEGSKESSQDEYEKEMMKLMENQLLLHRRLFNRLKATRERRDRMIEMLQTLWLNVSDLRSQASQKEHESPGITEKILARSPSSHIFLSSTAECPMEFKA